MDEKPETTKDAKATKAAAKTKIYSQASNDFVIPTYQKRDAKVQAPHDIDSAIIIAGGANVAFSASNKHQRNTKWAITEVNAEQLETLKAHKGFMRRVKNGYITIGEEPAELKADKSAQMTEKQVQEKTKAKAATGSVDE